MPTNNNRWNLKFAVLCATICAVLLICATALISLLLDYPPNWFSYHAPGAASETPDNLSVSSRATTPDSPAHQQDGAFDLPPLYVNLPALQAEQDDTQILPNWAISDGGMQSQPLPLLLTSPNLQAGQDGTQILPSWAITDGGMQSQPLPLLLTSPNVQGVLETDGCNAGTGNLWNDIPLLSLAEDNTYEVENGGECGEDVNVESGLAGEGGTSETQPEADEKGVEEVYVESDPAGGEGADEIPLPELTEGAANETEADGENAEDASVEAGAADGDDINNGEGATGAEAQQQDPAPPQLRRTPRERTAKGPCNSKFTGRNFNKSC